MKRKSLLLSVALLLLSVCMPWGVRAQVGIGILNPDSSAILHLESKTRGAILPRMTTAQRDAIANPADGLFIYNTTDSLGQYWNGACWLPFFAEDCNDCYFDLTLSSYAETIDRVLVDSAFTIANITQTNGPAQNIALAVVGAAPPGVTISFQNNPVMSTGQSKIIFKVTPFTPAGTYPIIIQAVCGGTIRSAIFSLTITPCYIVDVNNSGQNISISQLLYQQYPNAPTNTPICVVANVHLGVSIGSPTTTLPALTTGNLPAGSLVAIYNEGDIIGKGGDGGVAYDPAQGLTGNGFDGGHALNLTERAYIQNLGYIFGGGGGGGSMAFSIGYNIPVVNIFLGFIIGSGGGGGAGAGQGGQLGSGGGIGLIFYVPGANGSGGIFGQPGQGGQLNFPINFNIGPAQITINPNTIGGNGGTYGAPGSQGSFNVTMNISAVINIPFIGPITIPIVQNLNIPIPVPPPLPGNGGYAVKRNGNPLTNIPDNTYNTSFLKGKVGN